MGRKELAVTGNCTRCDDDDIFIFRHDKLAHRLNALYGMHFELSSCLAGIGASITGLGGVIGLGKACWTKYGYDSRYNTPAGTMPKVPETAVKTANTVEKVVSKLKG
jgi:hypothetical protein